MRTDFANTIAGTRSVSSEMLDVINPSTGAVVGRCPLAGEDQLEPAVQSAQSAFLAWAGLDYDRREALLIDYADRIEGEAKSLAELLTLEQGKPLRHSMAEITRGAATLRKVAKFRPEVERLAVAGRRLTELRWRPLGVTAAIVAWNAPVGLGLVKVANALITGNSVIWKPSPFTPLATLAVGELSIGCLPDGLLNVLAGSDGLGAALVAHPLVRKISFTGSVEVGKRIQASAAATMKRVTLELGGNDAAIVLPDADIDRAAEMIVDRAFWTTGQFCAAVKRVYVHEEIKEKLVAAMIERMRRFKIGDGFDPESDHGPIQNAPQFEKLNALKEETVAAGGRLLFEGDCPTGEGYFLPLTLVDGVDDEAPIVAEEQFGPILPILTFRDEEEALSRANGTRFGLGGSIWSRDIEHAQELAARLDVGNAWVNQHGALDVGIPFPFAKESGLGIDYGTHGPYQFLQPTLFSVAG